MSHEVKDLLGKMLHIVPQKRPLAAQILCHPWMLQQPPPEIRANDFSGHSQPHQEETAAALRGAVAATFRGKFVVIHSYVRTFD